MLEGQKGLSELGSGAGEVQGEEHWLQIGRLSLIVLLVMLELEIRLRVHTCTSMLIVRACKLEKPSDSGYTHTCNGWDVGVFSTHTDTQKPYKSRL